MSQEILGTTATQDIHEDDLYLTGTSVTMDKLVDGNVYIFANDVTITGQVNGNLFVFANKLSFSGSYVRNSIYAFANEVEFDGACNDLYIACNNMNVTYDSYVVRDVRAAVSSNLNFVGAVGRDAYLSGNNIAFGEGDSLGLIYGNLSYSTPSEISIPEGVVEGEVNYSAINNDSTEKSTQDIIMGYVFSLISALVYTFIVYLLMLWITPKFVERANEFVSSKFFGGLGIGIAASIIVVIASFFLLLIRFTAPVSFALIALYGLLLSISFAVVSVCITKKFAKSEQRGKTFGILALVTIVLWALQQLPFVGWAVSLIITMAGLGIVLLYAFTKNKAKKEEVKVTE